MINTKLTTDGLMSQLGEEVIESYDTGAGGKPVELIVDDLLAFQRKATKITKGTISVGGTMALAIVNWTILTALLHLQEGVGGYMFVDNDRALQWPTTIGENKGQQIRYRKNLLGLIRDIDYDGYCTKLHLTGGGDESLSNIIKTKVPVDKDSDASYGYLTLKETYACYKDWTGLGIALPANVKVYEGEAMYTYAWVSPINYSDPDNWWTDEPKAYDTNTGTFAYCFILEHQSPTIHDDPGSCWANEPAAYDRNTSSYAYTWPEVPPKTWTHLLYLAVSSNPGAGVVTATGIRFWVSHISAGGMRIEIYTSPDGENYVYAFMQLLYPGDSGKWIEQGFSARTVWDAKIRVYNNETESYQWYKLNEFQIKRARWSKYLELGVSASPGVGTIICTKVKLWFGNIHAAGVLLYIDVSPDGEEWHSVVSGASLGVSDSGVWKEYAVTKQTVWCARIKIFANDDYGSGDEFKLNEFYFQEATEDSHEVTTDFKQGADERTLRCAIGDYNAGANYLVSYTYTNYLMAWDKIVSADDIVAMVVTNKYEAYAISMLMAGTLLLDELKEIPITYKIATVDLSKNRDFKFSFEALQLGSTITVIDEELGINISARVVKLMHPDLLSPENMEIELSTRVKDISDYLVDLHKKFG